MKLTDRGFTLIEVFFALTMMTVAILGVLGLMQQTISFLPLSGQRLVASYLAQEGIEIVRNLRDSNKISGEVWDFGLTGCASGCEADFDDLALTGWVDDGRFLNIDSSFYKYSGLGEATPFQRKITIVSGTDVLEINVEISWSEKGRNHVLSTRENLYNW